MSNINLPSPADAKYSPASINRIIIDKFGLKHEYGMLQDIEQGYEIYVIAVSKYSCTNTIW